MAISPEPLIDLRSKLVSMLIDKSHVVQALESSGMTEQAKRAEQVLDVQVDTVRDADLLRELGIDPDRRAQGGNLATIEPRNGD